MKKSFVHLAWSQANISFKQSSQTDENVLKEDDKAGKQCQREHVNWQSQDSRSTIWRSSKRNRVNKTLEEWESPFKDLDKFGHLYLIQ